jgi:hypothetical protein
MPWYKGALYVPLYALRDSERFFAFRDVAEATQPPGIHEDFVTMLQHAWRQRLGRFARYEFPVVLIEPEPKAEVDDAAVSRIFERVNRTGQRLGAFDLVVARTYVAGAPRGNLRELWEETRISDRLIDRWLGDDGLAEDGMPLLQAMALASPRADVRQAAVLELDPSLIADQWPKAVEAVGQALRFLTDRCGVLRPDWLPYRAMLITLSGVAMEHDLFAKPTVVENWFWTRAFSLRFEAAANTRTVEEYVLLRAAIADGRLPIIEPVRVDALTRATRRRFQALFRAVLCLLTVNGARDLSGRSLAPGTSGLAPEDTDIVVASVLLRQPDSDFHLRAASMVLASRETARLLRRVGLDAVVTAAPSTLASQLLPQQRTAKAEVWIDRRVRLICDELYRRAGQPLSDGHPESATDMSL